MSDILLSDDEMNKLQDMATDLASDIVGGQSINDISAKIVGVLIAGLNLGYTYAMAHVHAVPNVMTDGSTVTDIAIEADEYGNPI